MVNLIGNFSRLDRKKILVAGDLMLDTYTIGKARRISPEAPVAVVEVQSEEKRAGGAGNAILNLISFGAEVIALGRVGEDNAGKELLQSLKQEGVFTEGIVAEKPFRTPIKNRIVADGQQIVRVDHEKVIPLSQQSEEQILEKLPSLLEGVDAIAISDYGKGFLSPRLLKELIQLARARKIFIIADPKGTDFTRYKYVNLLKPNLKETYHAAHKDPSSSLEEAAHDLLEKTAADYLMVTRSEEGISLFEKKHTRQDFPVAAKEVKDVTGAGDTVLAMLALAIANGLSLPTAIQFSNVAAGISIERFGCARITLSELAKRLLEIDATNKVFDQEHLHALQAALAGLPCTLVLFSGNTPPTSQEISLLTAHKKATNHAIVASIETTHDNEATINMLAALQPIDFILLNTPKETIFHRFPNAHLFI